MVYLSSAWEPVERIFGGTPLVTPEVPHHGLCALHENFIITTLFTLGINDLSMSEEDRMRLLGLESETFIESYETAAQFVTALATDPAQIAAHIRFMDECMQLAV